MTASAVYEGWIRHRRFEPVGHEFSRSNHDASLLVIEKRFGWVSDSAAFTTALAGGKSKSRV